jgi:hypothetical protein
MAVILAAAFLGRLPKVLAVTTPELRPALQQ